MTAWRPQTPMDAIALLRRHAARLEANQDEPGRDPSEAAELAAVAAILRDYEAQAPAGATLDAIWGLRPSSNTPCWWTAERRERRDDLLRQYVEVACGDAQTPTAAARKALAAVARVERARSPLQGPDAILAAALAAADRFPRSDRAIREILEARYPLQRSTATTEDRLE